MLPAFFPLAGARGTIETQHDVPVEFSMVGRVPIEARLLSMDWGGTLEPISAWPRVEEQHAQGGAWFPGASQDLAYWGFTADDAIRFLLANDDDAAQRVTGGCLARFQVFPADMHQSVFPPEEGERRRLEISLIKDQEAKTWAMEHGPRALVLLTEEDRGFHINGNMTEPTVPGTCDARHRQGTFMNWVQGLQQARGIVGHVQNETLIAEYDATQDADNPYAPGQDWQAFEYGWAPPHVQLGGGTLVFTPYWVRLDAASGAMLSAVLHPRNPALSPPLM